jgi:ferritin-like metal-binding protein YciE
MKQTMQKITTWLMVVLFSVALLSPVAMAHADSEGSESEVETTSATPTPESSTKRSKVRSVEHSAEEAREAVKEKIESNREKAKSAIEELKTKASGKSAEARQKACDARKSSMETIMNNAGRFAAKYKERFDMVFERAITFKEENALEVADYDSLIAAANNAGESVDAAVSALTDMEVTIDCTDPDSVATSLSAYKQGVEEARASLKTYRDAIKDVLKAIKAAAETEQSTDDTNETTN